MSILDIESEVVRTFLMVKFEMRNPIWLKLCGYRVVSLKPELDKHAIELERAIHEGDPFYPDPARADFYDVALGECWAYIHVYPQGRTVYLVAHSFSSISSFQYCYGESEFEHATRAIY